MVNLINEVDSRLNWFNEVYNGFKEFGHDVASIVNFFLLLIVYILGIGPVSIIAKLSKKHFLDITFREKISLWKERKPIEKQEEYYRQF